jgi:hypothetical protein
MEYITKDHQGCQSCCQNEKLACQKERKIKNFLKPKPFCQAQKTRLLTPKIPQNPK